MHTSSQPKLIDRFGRIVDYVRISITDRCDFRCLYCMAEDMTFLPRAQILSLEEIYTIAAAFTELGVNKIRITGGEPLIRKGVLSLLNNLGNLPNLHELVMTTNGSHLVQMAAGLKQAKVKRINISLDTLNPSQFKTMTRTGDLAQVLAGIAAAKQQGFEAIKLNAVILKNRNHTEVCNLVQFAIDEGLDISFIEEMPLGIISEHNRAETYYSSAEIRRDLSHKFDLNKIDLKTAGPSDYFQVHNTSTHIGFISPHSANFCSTCNRVRITTEGRLLLCLGNEHSVDLKAILRQHPNDTELLKQTIIQAMELKPEKHEFNLNAQPIILRHMNTTGG